MDHAFDRRVSLNDCEDEARYNTLFANIEQRLIWVQTISKNTDGATKSSQMEVYGGFAAKRQLRGNKVLFTPLNDSVEPCMMRFKPLLKLDPCKLDSVHTWG